jgi:NAD(P)-dependent dehydrogenase (short-subunit alcohol dehydrogenase family)
MSTLFITGASRGLGLEFVRQYAADGWDVIAACRNPAKADALQNLAGQNKKVRIETMDVNDPASVLGIADKLKGTGFDVLINNAGIFSGQAQARSANQGDPTQDFGTIDGEAWGRVLYTNTIAPILTLQAFTEHLAKGTQAKAVNITSRMGSIAEMGNGYIAYRSSKAALNAAMCVIAPALADRNITIVNLHPGWVKTDMGGPNATLTPEASITGMRSVIAKLTKTQHGQFLSYDGKVIPW